MASPTGTTAFGWSALGSGLNDFCSDIVVDASGNVYVGGGFTTAGGIPANSVAKWDGTNWSSLGTGLNDVCLALALDGAGNLYAGGGFTMAGGVAANGVAKWDGTAWSALGSGLEVPSLSSAGTCYDLALDAAGNVYACGSFTVAGGAAADNIAKWDGSNWSPLGSGLSGAAQGLCFALAIDGTGQVYAGGRFSLAGGISANRVAKWDGTAWSALGSGVGSNTSQNCRTLAVDAAGNLYAGGNFTEAGGVPVNLIAKWDGTNWSGLGSGLVGPPLFPSCLALAFDGAGNLYAGGGFSDAGGVAATNIAKWDGTTWSNLDSGVGPTNCDAIAIGNTGNLYAGGVFSTAGGTTVNRIAEWSDLGCTAPPTANCPTTVTVNNTTGQCGANVTFSIPAPTDDCGATSVAAPASGSFFAVGSTLVTVTATDADSNTDQCTFNVIVNDNENPVAVCLNSTVFIDPNTSTYNLQQSDVFDAANSSDNCGITSVSFAGGTFTCNQVGNSFPVSVMVSDAAGKMDNCTANVTVDFNGTLPSAWTATDVGTAPMGNSYSFDPCTGSGASNGEFTIEGSGNNLYPGTTSDAVAYISQTLCGNNGQGITAKIESVDPNGYAGLMVRETTAAGSKQTSIFTNLTNLLLHEVRYSTGAQKVKNTFYKPFPIWLRMFRQGNNIFAYYSTDGFSFQYVHTVPVQANSCLEYGLAAFSNAQNQSTTAVFSNVSVGTIPNPFLDPDVVEEGVNVSLNLGVEQPRYELYPNPTTNQFTLDLRIPVDLGGTALLHDATGRVIAQQNLLIGTVQMDWDLSDVPVGVYLLEVQQEGVEPQLLRVVKQ